MTYANWLHELEAFLDARSFMGGASGSKSYQLGYLKSMFASQLAQRPEMAHEVTENMKYALKGV